GEESAPCGACDICRSPPQLVDASDAARLVVAAIVETGEMFGAAFIIDVLRGAETQKLRDKNAGRFAAFGRGADRPATEWRAIIRQMTAAGLLRAEPPYGSLKLAAPRGASLDDLSFSMRLQKSTNERRRRASGSAAPAGPDGALFSALKAKRLEIARERGVPAYAVFTDRTLIDMAKRRPRSAGDFGEVFGVGAAKVRAFSEDFLAVVAEFGDA
ncbi:MAG: HRDC domain-containing protein, partial [Pseudomonadota bacterium]